MLKAEAAFKILVNFCKKVGFSAKDSILKALISVFSSGFLNFWGYKYNKMTVEEIRADHENYDKFPIGLRVLAVDDDPICLRLLETLLRKCQYHVTTSNQARMALNMLRENRDRFDLVISDVHMPDMDGFKLLELVGLEMDLPVIMLSANGDPKNVMKGVTHGACDYLVKPVRIEELKNIWQHVIRRKKSDSKSQNKCADEARTHKASGEAHGSPNKGKVDQNGKLNRKRKDEEDDSEDDGNESEDPTTQKRPRVVWSIELHRKFVAAVNQLGIEKAVPKRILDMMNVDGLTRENVASHLQKYRLYLKRISSVANHQVNMVAALGGRDAPFMRIGSLDGFGEFRNLAGPGRLTNVALSPYNTGGMLGRLNSPANVSLHNLTSSALIQPSPAQNLSNSTAVGKMHPFLSHASQNPSLFQGIPSSLELDQLQQNKCATGIPNFNAIDASRVVDVFNPGAVIASSSNSLDNNPKNQTLSGGRFGIQSSHNMASFNSESFYGSSNLLDPGAIESYKMQPNSMLSAGAFRVELPIDSARENNYSHGHLQNNPVELSTTNMASLPIEDSRKVQFQEGLVGDLHSTNQAPNQRWEDHRQNYGHNSNNNFGSLNSHVPADTIVSSLDGSLDQNSGIFDQKMHMFMNARSDGGASTLMQQNGNEKMATESRARSSENFLLEQPKFHGGFAPQGYDTLDVLVNSMIKQEQDATIPNYQFGFNDYSLGPGM